MALELTGRQGKTVIVDGNTVKISKKGGIFASNREKTLPIRNITSVEVKKPGIAFVGFIQFSIAGGKVNDSSFKFSGGTVDAAKDENSIVFSDKKSYEIAIQMKDYIEHYCENQAVNVKETAVSAADEIIKYKKLLDDGVLTQEEFDSKKKELLGL